MIFADRVQQNDLQLEEMRKKVSLENKALETLKKLLFYSILMTVLFQVAYSKTSSHSFNYQTQLQNLLLPNITLVELDSKSF